MPARLVDLCCLVDACLADACFAPGVECRACVGIGFCPIADTSKPPNNKKSIASRFTVSPFLRSTQFYTWNRPLAYHGKDVVFVLCSVSLRLRMYHRYRVLNVYFNHFGTR